MKFQWTLALFASKSMDMVGNSMKAFFQEQKYITKRRGALLIFHCLITISPVYAGVTEFDKFIDSLPGENYSLDYLTGTDSYPAYRGRVIPGELFKGDSSPIKKYTEWCAIQGGEAKKYPNSPSLICDIEGKSIYGLKYKNYYSKEIIIPWELYFYREEDIILVYKNQAVMEKVNSDKEKAQAVAREKYRLQDEYKKQAEESEKKVQTLKCYRQSGPGAQGSPQLIADECEIMIDACKIDKNFFKTFPDRNFLVLSAFNTDTGAFDFFLTMVSGDDGLVRRFDRATKDSKVTMTLQWMKEHRAKGKSDEYQYALFTSMGMCESVRRFEASALRTSR